MKVLYDFFQTHFLGSLGGNSVGDTVRKVCRRLCLNGVWSGFSLKGKHQKKSLQAEPVYKVITSKFTLFRFLFLQFSFNWLKKYTTFNRTFIVSHLKVVSHQVPINCKNEITEKTYNDQKPQTKHHASLYETKNSIHFCIDAWKQFGEKLDFLVTNPRFWELTDFRLINPDFHTCSEQWR